MATIASPDQLRFDLVSPTVASMALSAAPAVSTFIPTSACRAKAQSGDIENDDEPFGSWLVKQHQHRKEWLASLAKSARADPRFPKLASTDDVRAYLSRMGADGDTYAAVDDAEAEWERSA